ncbi:Mut7-C RNAse domain-containing protein [Halomonas ramblicola]|uniref:Mut7-C RNAse domain-containing protein n=1 Tax=Halomonas ramblicola TaxID=747349 RepID=UPI0025B4301C|nr:Mut7-C RNAse domain-containing protein [Halomonas ramblicola]MDN3520157.1 Mut7-C RNAse domain-containing protein [Halomonas ramblicola]
MPSAEFRFHGELNDFLAPVRRRRPFAQAVTRRASVKDVIEALGVPHTEVDVIVVDGVSVGFDHRLEAGACPRVAVYPWSLAPPLAEVHHLRPRPPRPPRWVLDVHLGRLAGYLRLLGFDCRYRNDLRDPELAACAAEEGRVLLTRDRRLLQRRCVTLGHFVRADAPRRQLEEVCAVFDLYDAFAPFSRCTRCNGRLAPVEKARVVHRLEPLTRRYVERFLECRDCGQLYWHGSHMGPMRELVAQLRRGRPDNDARGRYVP